MYKYSASTSRSHRELVSCCQETGMTSSNEVRSGYQILQIEVIVFSSDEGHFLNAVLDRIRKILLYIAMKKQLKLSSRTKTLMTDRSGPARSSLRQH